MPHSPQKGTALPDPIFNLEIKWGEVIKGVGGGWTAIPNILLRKQVELGISPSELNVLINLIRFWWEPGQAPFPSPEKTATEIGISTRTVYRILASLEEKGLIKRIITDGEATRYELDDLVKKLQLLKTQRSSNG